jgi:hypothetical protein
VVNDSQSGSYDSVGYRKTRLRVVDLRDPKNVKTTALDLDDKYEYSGLVYDGDLVFTSHFEPNDGDPKSERGRFYLDRFDVSNPTSPSELSQINVPGVVMHVLPGAGRAITTELVKRPVDNITPSACYERFANAEFEYPEQPGGGDATAAVGSGSGGSSAVQAGTATASASTAGAAAAVPLILPLDAAPAAEIKSESSAGAADGGVASDAPESTGASIARPGSPYYPPEEIKGRCLGRIQRLHLVRFEGDKAVLEDSVELSEKEQVSDSSLGDGVLFANVSRGGYYYPLAATAGVVSDAATSSASGDIVCIRWPCGPNPEQPTQLLVLSGLNDGRIDDVRLRVEDTSNDDGQIFYGSTSIHAVGKRALLVGPSQAAIIDAASGSPSIQKRIPLIGAAQSVDLKGNTALIALGERGVQWITF